MPKAKNTVFYRPLDAADVTEAVTLIGLAWSNPESQHAALVEMQDGLNAPEGVCATRFIMATLEDGTAVGVAGWAPLAISFSMYGLCWAVVHPDYRHQGIGAGLLDARLAEIAAKNRGNPYCVMVKTWDNPLYRQRGFVAGFQEEIQDPKGRSILLAQFG